MPLKINQLTVIIVIPFKCMREMTNYANYVEGYFIPADTYAAMKTAIKTKGFA